MDKIPFSLYDFLSYLASGFLFLITIDYAFFDLKNVAKASHPIGLTIFWLILAYILGHLVAHISSILLENYFLRKVLISPEEHLLAQESDSFWKKFFPDNFKTLPKPTQDRIIAQAEKQGVCTSSMRSFFFHCHAIVKRDRVTLERLNLFLNQYGFCRNITMVLLIAAVILLPVIGLIQLEQGTFGDSNGQKFMWGFAALFGAYGMFTRYLKFFHLYTKEVFMSYAEPHPYKNDVN